MPIPSTTILSLDAQLSLLYANALHYDTDVFRMQRQERRWQLPLLQSLARRDGGIFRGPQSRRRADRQVRIYLIDPFRWPVLCQHQSIS